MTELWIPAERLLRVLEKHHGPISHYPDGIPRRLTEIRSGRQGFVSLTVADKMLVTMGLEHWLRVPAEQGGLADIYVEEKQYGRPETARTKYGSAEERLRARRHSYWDAKRRSAERKVPVACVSCGEERLVRADYVKQAQQKQCIRCSNAIKEAA